MLEIPVKKMMKGEPLMVASSTSIVRTVCRKMAERGISAVVVVDKKVVVGIFTERDAVFRVMAQDRDPASTRLRDVMTSDPATVAPADTFGHALALMHERGFRHVPVVENGRPVGIVTARDALDPDLDDFVCEVQRRKAIRRPAPPA